MTTPLVRLRSLGVSVLLVLATAGFLAAPAQADAPRITFRAPGDGQQLPVSSFQVSVLVEMAGTLTGDINLNLKPLDADSRQAPINASTAANGSSSQEVSFPARVDYNGKYLATVRATGRDKPQLLIEDDRLETATATREFFVVAPPAAPTNVRPVIDKESRVVTLSWNANSEKDLLFYVVQRAKGDGAFSPLGATDGPRETSMVDPSTAESGGEYRYQVVAVRRGADAEKGVNSDPSPVAKASVPAPPGPAPTEPDGGTTGTTTVGGTPSPGGSTPSGTTGTTLSPNSPGALKKSGTIDLSGFSSLQNHARRSAPRTVESDPGFTEALPFGTTNTTRLLGDEPADEENATAGDDHEVRELGAEDASNERQKSAAFLAAGLLATVLLMHLLWIKGEVQREPLEALVPE